MTRADLPLLDGWLREPHVAAWWRDEPPDLEAVTTVYGACIDGDDPTELFLITVADRPVGMIQRYRFADEPDWRAVFDGIVDVSDAASFDYLVGDPVAVGRGIGTEAVRRLVMSTWQWRPVTSIVVNVQQANPASWRVLEKAGFSRLWAGELDSPDPSDHGPEYIYAIRRP
jgi:aminoglycoside 6'-N-acetyltransferase